MLISPLMGHILSCGLALTLADWQLGEKAARNVILSVVETILIAALCDKSFVSHDSELPHPTKVVLFGPAPFRSTSATSSRRRVIQQISPNRTAVSKSGMCGRQLSPKAWHLTYEHVKFHDHFGAKAAAAIAAVILLLAMADARNARPKVLHAQPQFRQGSTAAPSTYTLVDGFDLALLTCTPVFNFPAPSSHVRRSTGLRYQSRLDDFPCHVRPPPAA
jgi:Domain of unknown function (DUF389)